VSADLAIKQASTRSWLVRWPLGTALAAYVACRFLVLVFLWISNLFLHRGFGQELSLWDGKWFIEGVVSGWPSHLPMINGHVAANPIAFFPALPLAIRFLGLFGLSPVASGVLISGVTGFVAVIAVYKLTDWISTNPHAARAALLFALFPGTFAFSLVYSEGIVITCVGFGLLFLLQRRWLAAGILGLIASAASPVGLVFAVSCSWAAVVAIVKRGEWRSLVAPVLAPLGAVAWMLYLRVHTGTWNAWRLTERGGWKSYPSLAYPIRIIDHVVLNPISPTLTGWILFIGTAVGIFGIYVMAKEHQPAPLFLYGLGALVAAAISVPVGLRPRFLMLAFPIIIGFATRFGGWKYRTILMLEVLVLIFMINLTFDSFAVFP
jgi:hypothetical protein